MTVTSNRTYLTWPTTLYPYGRQVSYTLTTRPYPDGRKAPQPARDITDTWKRSVEEIKAAIAETKQEEKKVAQATLYIYAVIKTELRDSINGNITDPAEILVQPTAVVAYDEGQARAVASRAIPEAVTEDMSRIVVLVRPF